MADLEELLDRLERLLIEVEGWEEPYRGHVLDLLDGLDGLHRVALGHLGEALGPSATDVRAAHPAVAWLFDAYGIGVDQRAAADAALEQVRPYIHSHGGRLELLDVRGGVVRVKMAGSCAGCTASARTLRDGVEEALRSGLPGFAGLEVEEEPAAPHPPPDARLLPIQPTRR